MRARTIDLLLVIALIAGVHYYFEGRTTPFAIAEKGSCVAIFALWAGLQARGVDGSLIAAVLAFGALGDVLIETSGLVVGALAFLAGHLISIVLYLRNRQGRVWLALSIAMLVALVAWSLPADRQAAPGIATYALGLGAMAGAALISRFPRRSVGVGAMLFVTSDLLIFARMGPLNGAPLPGLLIWPSYIAAQAMIAWGIVGTLREERE